MTCRIIELERFAHLPAGTFGRLKVPGQEVLYTVEKPWRRNHNDVSCIPDGAYPLALRDSPVVGRSTAGEFTRGWEVVGVPGRTFIMLHPANWPSDIKGCIGMGKAFAHMADPKGDSPYGVSNSRQAFREFMGWLEELGDEWLLHITSLAARL